jgi:hypothetical protein
MVKNPTFTYKHNHNALFTKYLSFIIYSNSFLCSSLNVSTFRIRGTVGVSIICLSVTGILRCPITSGLLS